MKVITLCGSNKFKNEMAEVAEIMTLAGNCVLTPNELTRDSKDDYTEEEAQMIDLIRDSIDNPFYVFYSPALKYNVIYTFLNCASSKTLDFASSYAKNNPTTQAAYEALIAGYQAAVDAGM